MTQTTTPPKPQILTLLGNLPIKLKIDVWSDIYCPWCYIGKRRLEKALSQFEHADQVEINWHSYQLDPDAPLEFNGDINAMLVEMKGISRQRAEQMHAQLTALAAKDGLDYRFDKVRVGNSLNAHRLVHFAALHKLQAQMQERLFHAYFTEGLSVGDIETLTTLGAEVGLDATAVREMLNSTAFADDVRNDQQKAYEIGVQGVPFFVFAEKYAVSGAQPVELFTTALQKAWDDLQATGLCTDDSCTVL
jgi:predicted DsbA family dithiol-disulfide isomerase